ncbi:MAG: GH3 auxin-responsive promoter family protein [Chitinophagales bacterium]
MRILSFFIRPLAKIVTNRIYSKHAKATDIQLDILSQLIQNSKQISFGKDHGFDTIRTYDDFKKKLKLQDYESLKKYIDRSRKGEKDVLWKGKVLYFAKTSGTSSGSKYIPISRDSMSHHISAARNSLFAYIAETGKADFFNRKMIFLQGSPVMDQEHGIPIGRLSGIVYHHVPAWLLSNRLPSYKANCIEDWDEKVAKIVEESLREDMSLLSGIPPWCLMYFQSLLKKSAKENLRALYPNLQLYVHGGVNYAPYKDRMSQLLGEGVDTIETYPASEGFFAYQDSQKEEGLLLNIDAGIFYEFVALRDWHTENPRRLHLGEVRINENYVLIVSTNAGLWAYNTGDTVKFVHINPYRIVVSGRTKHFISAFGEHVIQEEVEKAISLASTKHQLEFVEFTVAPNIQEEKGKSCHLWYIEFKHQEGKDRAAFMQDIDALMQEQNEYYRDLRGGGMLAPATLIELSANAFRSYFEESGKLGGQNKVQHLANDRILADKLEVYVKKG